MLWPSVISSSSSGSSSGVVERYDTRSIMFGDGVNGNDYDTFLLIQLSNLLLRISNSTTLTLHSSYNTV
jgi:hypothetical protein